MVEKRYFRSDNGTNLEVLPEIWLSVERDVITASATEGAESIPIDSLTSWLVLAREVGRIEAFTSVVEANPYYGGGSGWQDLCEDCKVCLERHYFLGQEEVERLVRSRLLTEEEMVKYATVQEATARLGGDDLTVKRLCETGSLQSVHFADDPHGINRAVTRESLDAELEKRRAS